jgi:hypothetical protein
VAPDGGVYLAGVTESKDWPSIPLTQFGKPGATDGFVVRFDLTGKKRSFGIRIGGSRDDSLASIALDSHGDIYVVGSTDSTDFPVAGANLGKVGGALIVKINGQRFCREASGGDVVKATRRPR